MEICRNDDNTDRLHGGRTEFSPGANVCVTDRKAACVAGVRLGKGRDTTADS